MQTHVVNTVYKEMNFLIVFCLCSLIKNWINQRAHLLFGSKLLGSFLLHTIISLPKAILRMCPACLSSAECKLSSVATCFPELTFILAVCQGVSSRTTLDIYSVYNEIS